MTPALSLRVRTHRGISPLDHLTTIRGLRDDWLRLGLSTDPANRPAAEAAITELYRLIRAAPPEFVWVPSPRAAVDLLCADPGDPQPWPSRLRQHGEFRTWPVLSRLVSAKSTLRHRLWSEVTRARLAGTGAPGSATAVSGAGTLLGSALDTVARQPLRDTLYDGLYRPLRRALLAADQRIAAVAGYEQYDTWSVAYFDICRSTGVVEYPPELAHELAQWSALARSAGWWWPGPHRCVLAERPTVIRTEPRADDRNGAVRIHHPDRRAVEFIDGTGCYALHGTVVPEPALSAATGRRIRAVG